MASEGLVRADWWPIKAPQQFADVFVVVSHPIASKGELILTSDGPFEPHDCVDPRRELLLNEKLRIGAILTTAVGRGIR